MASADFNYQVFGKPLVKALLGSDLHIEFGKLNRIPAPPAPDTYDVVLLAGDIGMGTTGLKWARSHFPVDKPIYFTPGNHEFYREDYQKLNQEFLEVSDTLKNVTVLNPGVAPLSPDVVLIAATMWSNLHYEGVPTNSLLNWQIDRSISDFRVISNGTRRFTVEDMIEVNQREMQFIDSTKKYLSKKKIVVMTHFLPSALCTAPQFVGSPINAYFASDQDGYLDGVDTWIFGHTHTKMDFTHPSGARLVCNPAGYPNENRESFQWQILTF